MASGNTENPKVLTLLPIAQHFGLTIYDLMNNQPLPTPQPEENKTTLYEIPFITFSHIKRWLETTAKDSAESTTIDRFVSEQAFATRLTDSSMRPTMPEGTIAIIDPNHSPQNLDYILVYRKNSGHCLIKQLLIDGEQNLLKPHNRDFQIQPLREDDHIVGPVVQTRIDHKE